MKYRKFNKYEKKEVRKAAIASALAGGGRYIYENSNANADLTLPRPTKTGVRKVAPGGCFQGDDYYMQLVRSGMLRLVEILETKEEEAMNEQKLILEQPDTVTTEGTVEQVVVNKATPKKVVAETAEENNSQPVLLNETPGDDGFVIVDES